MFCNGCGDDVYFEDLDYYDDRVAYCFRCWPKHKDSHEREKERLEKIGHTGDGLCGCSMCAAKADMGLI